jgi:hypothetical protein
MIGAFLMIVMLILRFISPDGELGAYLDLAGTLFSIFVIMAIYTIHQKNSGTWTLVSFIIALIGTVLWVGVKWVHAIVVPALGLLVPEFVDQPPASIIGAQMVSFVIFMIGWVLIGLIIGKQGYLPRMSGVLLVITPILDFVPYGYYLAQPLFAITILWISYLLFKGIRLTDTQKI